MPVLMIVGSFIDKNKFLVGGSNIESTAGMAPLLRDLGRLGGRWNEEFGRPGCFDQDFV